MKYRRFLFAMLILIFFMVGIRVRQAHADEGRWLTSEQIIFYGLGLIAEPAHQTVPKDIATIVSTYLQAPDLSGETILPIPDDVQVKATLRGPGLQTPMEMTTDVNRYFNIPPLAKAGTYVLENIRVVSGDEIIFYATPESVTIEVIDQLLVTQVTARPLTANEIKDRGIIFDSSDFQAYNFTAAFAVKPGQEISINFPVLLPTPDSVSGVTVESVTSPQFSAGTLRNVSTLIPDTLELAQTRFPNLYVKGFSLSIDEEDTQAFSVPPIPGVIVIPGDIGLLNQYFSVMLMVGNVAPDGSGLVVEDLSAEIILPPGNDTVVGSSDDPLTMAETEQGEASRIQPVMNPGSDGNLGTADDRNILAPGDSGNAEFLVEGMREGTHTVEMEITGTLKGLSIGPVTVRGRAAGAVLVRNPSFTLTFVHPDVVNDGEEYDLDVIVTNTSASPANFVSINLRQQNISGANLVGEATKDIEYIAPGDSASVNYRLRSRVTGSVYAATLDSDDKISGRFELKTSVGELGIPLSPDSIVLPKEAGFLPAELKTAGTALLGKAYAAATAPASLLPADMMRFSKKIVWNRGVDMAEAGLRYALHEPLTDTAEHLLFDFCGIEYARISEKYPNASDAGKLKAEQDNYLGFDHLRRKSLRGDVFADAIASLLYDDLSDLGAAEFHQDFAENISFRPQHLSILISSDNGPMPLSIILVDDQGNVLGGMDKDHSKVIKEIPFGDYLEFKNSQDIPTSQMALVAFPQASGYRIRLIKNPDATADDSCTLSVVMPADTPSGLRQIVFEDINVTDLPVIEKIAGDPYDVSIELYENNQAITGQQIQPDVTQTIDDPEPTVISVVQQADLDRVHCCKADDCSMAGVQVGRVIALLFSEEVTPESVQDQFDRIDITHYEAEANKVVSVAMQPGGRVVYLALRDPIGPFIERQITITAVSDLRGNIMNSWSGPIEATITEEGALLTGTIMNADGTPVELADVRYFIWNGECGWAGISAKNAGVDGTYTWDFAVKNRRGKIVAIDPETQISRTILFDVARSGQRLNVNVVFLGRGALTGYALAEDGFTPLEGATVKVTSMTDYTEYGTTSDQDGMYVIQGIPTGSIMIEAAHVKPADGSNPAVYSHVTQSQIISYAGETVDTDLILLSEQTHQISIDYGSVNGAVLESDNVTPVADVPVIVYYRSGSQEGVTCPQAAPPNWDCPVAFGYTDELGKFSFDQIPAGELRVYTYDQARLIESETSIQLQPDQSANVNILLSGGLGAVRGIVLDADGNPVAGATVGGGLSLTTTDENGVFLLEDVPVGKRSIVAVSTEIGANGISTIDVVAEGENVYATMVLGATGSITGTVYETDGITPVANLNVYLWRTGDWNEIIVAGTAVTDAGGHYSINKVPLFSGYTLSAFRPDFTAGNTKAAALEFNGQTLRTDITFVGSGRINGVIYDDDGITPLKALVSLSCLRVHRAGPVGLGFQFTQHARVIENDITTGAFTFNNVFVGPFVIATAGPFNQQMTTVDTAFGPSDVLDPVTLAGVMPYDDAELDVTLQLVPTSQVEGSVFMPDGVTPVGPDVMVHFRGYKILCTPNGCFERPQGIQEETVVTDENGHFTLPLVNPGKFELTAEVPEGASLPEGIVSGMIGQIRGTVQAGQTADINFRLLNLSDVTVHVFAGNGTDPIPNAQVEIQHAVILDVEAGLNNNSGFSKIERTGTADSDGIISFSGADALPEGELTILAKDPATGFAGRACVKITDSDENIAVNVYLFNAIGSVYGTIYEPNGYTPVANAEVVISNDDGSLGYLVSGEDGTYRFDMIPLGNFDVRVFDPASGRRGIASGSVDLADQEVALFITETPLGYVTGTAFNAADLTPLKGWDVKIRQPDQTGTLNPQTVTNMRIWYATTGIDGSFIFPGIPLGTFDLVVEKGQDQKSIQGRITRDGEIVDIPVLVNLSQDPLGTIQGTIYYPDGTAASNVEVYLDRYPPEGRATTSDVNGFFVFENVTLGRHRVIAMSQVTEDTASRPVELTYTGEAIHASIILQGTGTVEGTVEWQDGTVAAGMEVNLLSMPVPACEPESEGMPPVCTAYADQNGVFTFINIPAGKYTIEAVNPVDESISGSNGGTLVSGETAQVRIVLEPVGSITARVLASDGSPVSGVTARLYQTNPPAWTPPLVLFAETDETGMFTIKNIPVGDPVGIYLLTLEDPLGIGVAKTTLSITTQGESIDLGDIFLDDTRPQVQSVDPSSGARGVAMDKTVTISFSEPINPGSVDLNSIVLADEDGQEITGYLEITDADMAVTFTPIIPLSDETRYSLWISAHPNFNVISGGDFAVSREDAAQCYSVLVHFDDYDADDNGYLSESEYPAGVEDYLGHVMQQNFVSNFTTVDITEPAFADLSPAPDTGGVSVESVIRITYTEPIDASAFSSDAVVITDGQTNIDGRIDIILGNKVIVFTPAWPLALDTQYHVTLPAATDLAGNVQAQGLEYDFSTTDNTPPVVQSLTLSDDGSVIEEGIGSVSVNMEGAYDVAFVDFYINGLLFHTDRVAPFELSFEAVEDFGSPGDVITISAVATDTSGNRGEASGAEFIIVADALPAAAVLALSPGSQAYSGQLVTLTVTAQDDLGIKTIAYHAAGGQYPAFSTRVIDPSETVSQADFSFFVPADAVPGSVITVNASAIDTRGQEGQAVPVEIEILDATDPVVHFAGFTTGMQVTPGEMITVVVSVTDLGGVSSITFSASGAAAYSETRQISPTQNSVASTFTFIVPASATAPDDIILEATAVDQAGNISTRAQVILTVADLIAPVVSLETTNLEVAPGDIVNIVATATDAGGITHIDLSGTNPSGSITYTDSHPVSPPSSSAQKTFDIIVPADSADGDTITFEAMATDMAGNMSQVSALTLTIRASYEVTLPDSMIMLAGDETEATIEINRPAPAGGLLITLSSEDASVAQVTSSVTIDEDQTSGIFIVSALSSELTTINASIDGALRASMTISVNGGVVSGKVLSETLPGQLDPVPNAELNINGTITHSDTNGDFLVTGISSSTVTIRALDGTTGLRGYFTGAMNTSGGFLKDVVIVLVPAGTVSGIVLNQDGVPVGNGVSVSLHTLPYRPASDSVYGPVFTNENGLFEFPLVELGGYAVAVHDMISGDRGMAEAHVTSTGQNINIPITYLGRGDIEVSVVDSEGPVSNAELSLRSSSIFGQISQSPITDASGIYTFEGIFIGDFTLSAVDPLSNTGTRITGIITNHEQVVPVTLQVGEWASLNGRVFRYDGTTPVPGAKVKVGNAGWALTDENGNYSLEIIPLGTHSIVVTHEDSRGYGTSSVALNTSGLSEIMDIDLLGQGTLIITVADGNGQAVEGAEITVSDQVIGWPVYTTTDSNGNCVVQRINEGNVNITALSNGLTGKFSGSIEPDDVLSVTVTLQETGTISGTLYYPNGTLVENAQVRLISSGSDPDPVITQTDGKFIFNNIPIETIYDVPIPYRIDVYEGGQVSASGGYTGGMLRARVDDIVLNDNGQIMDLNVNLIGVGIVTGQVRMPDSSSAGAMPVTVRSLTAIYGRTYSTTTDAAGYYTVERIAVGAVSVTSGNMNQQIWGEGDGEIIDDGDSTEIDIMLGYNAISLPRDIYDANHFRFDIQTDGSLSSGQNIFRDENTLDSNGAATLSIVANGVETAFTGGEVPVEEDLGRETVARQLGIAGLNITRKVYVPLEGYFARYLEILSNPTSEEITVDVLVKTAFRDSNTLITATSNGDDLISPAGEETPDYWAALDDDGTGDPFLVTYHNYTPVAFVWAGPDASLEPESVEFMPYASPVYPNVISTWNSVSIPAGESVAIMHFISQQASRDGAAASAQRLVNLPPEALEGMSLAEIETVQNFVIPEGGTSGLDILPKMNAQVSGQVFASDGTTLGYPSCEAFLKSSHPLFARTYKVNTNASGYFEFIPDPVTDPQWVSIIGIPVHDFTLSARKYTYYVRNSLSPDIPCSFPEGTHILGQDIVFSTTGIFEGTVRKATGEVISGANIAPYLIIENSTSEQRGTGTSIEDGAYSIAFLPPGDYSIEVSVPHSQGYANTKWVTGTIIEGQTIQLDVTMPPVGVVSGTVIDFYGNVVHGAQVQLREIEGDYFRRETVTDTGGNYTLTDVPTGTYALIVYDPETDGPVEFIVTVGENTTTTQNFNFPNYTSLPKNLIDGGGYVWDINLNGSIRNGTDDAFDNAGYMINPSTFASFYYAVAEDDDREFVMGPYERLSWRTTRKIFVPADDRFIRYLDIIENISEAPETLTYRIYDYLGASSDWEIIETSSGDNVFNTYDTWVITRYNGSVARPVVLHVFAGIVSPVLPNYTYTNIPTSGDYFAFGFGTPVQAGETVAFMHFISQQPDVDSARVQAEALLCLKGSALSGLSPEEQDMVINFYAYTDADCDGMPDGYEDDASSNPNDPDSDSDGMFDGFEWFNGFDPTIPGDHLLDADNDGLDNLGEYLADTNPHDPDTDGGGLFDGIEVVENGSDPHDPADDTVSIPQTLIDGDGYRWDILRYSGSIDQGTDNAFTEGLRMIFGSWSYNAGWGTYAYPENGGRELLMTPYTVGDIRVRRKIFVPDDEGFARYLEIVENSGDTELTTSVRISSSMGAGSHSIIAATSNGNTTFETNDDFIVIDDDGTLSTPAVAFVFSGPYAEVMPDVVTTNIPGSNSVSYTFEVTVPAGERRIIMHFASQNSSQNAAIMKASDLRCLAENALAGLSDEERSDIINFIAYPDSDCDGLSDEDELFQATDPNSHDSDGDKLMDGFEFFYGLNPLEYNDSTEDPDNDGLDNLEEQAAETDPFDPDTDGGLTFDGDEVYLDKNPLDPADDLSDLPVNLVDLNNYLWDIQRDGRIYSGGKNVEGSINSYSNGLDLTVNSSGFLNFYYAVPEQRGREFFIGKQTSGDLVISRKVFVPENDAFVRYLELVENTSLTDSVTATIEIESALFYGSAIEIVSISSGNPEFTTSDDYIICGDLVYAGRPVLAHVFSGPDTDNQPSYVYGISGQRYLRYHFEVTIPAGERRILMHFASQNDNETDAYDSAAKLYNLQDSTLDGLSTDEKADIVNFTIP
jgi:Bacterial Ig-like domain/Carboxypeptidase regulatory-like domain